MPTDTKTAILDSAERAARSRGFDGFSYADLAADVGLRKASIHHHFATKAALSVALMHRYATTLQTACATIDATEPTGAARISAFIQRYRDALDGGRSLCLCVSFSMSRESLPSDVTVQLGRFREAMVDWLENAFALAKSDGTITLVNDPTKEAAATLPLLEGAQLAARAAENPELFENAIQLLTDRLNTTYRP